MTNHQGPEPTDDEIWDMVQRQVRNNEFQSEVMRQAEESIEKDTKKKEDTGKKSK